MNSLFLLYSLQTLSYGGNFAQNIGMHDFAISFFCSFPGEHAPIPPYPHIPLYSPREVMFPSSRLRAAWSKISLPVIKHLNSLKCASSTLICCAINMVPFWWEGRRHQCNFLWSVIIGMVISMSNLSDLWLILSAFHDGHKAITSHLVSWKTGGFVSILKYWAAAQQQNKTDVKPPSTHICVIIIHCYEESQAQNK